MVPQLSTCVSIIISIALDTVVDMGAGISYNSEASMSDNAKVMENRLRRTADRLGFSVSKSRVTGLWRVVDEECRFFTGADLENATVEKVAELLEEALRMEAAEVAKRQEADERFFREEARSKYPLLFGANEADDF